MAAHSSILAWKIPWTAEPGRLPSMGWQSRTGLGETSSKCILIKTGAFKVQYAYTTTGCLLQCRFQLSKSGLGGFFFFNIFLTNLFILNED